MISTLAVHGYRCLRDLVLPLGPLTVITGANGSGKSSLYQAFRLLAGTATGDLIGSLAAAGGLESVLWAGPETVSAAMRRGEVQVSGTVRRQPVSLQMGFAGDTVGYLVDVGLPAPDQTTMFGRDPLLKRELVWGGPVLRPAALLVERRSSTVRVRDDEGFGDPVPGLSQRESVLPRGSDPARYPELAAVRAEVTSWRFYDPVRADPLSPARRPQVGTWSPVLDHDGENLAAALQTIRESTTADLLEAAVDRAFPGSRLEVTESDGWFGLALHQPGLLRPVGAGDLSDGTLRFLALAAALLSPQPPSLLVLNEPETSLHPQLLPAVAELVGRAAERTQVVVVTHAADLAERLAAGEQAVWHELAKDLGETVVVDQGLLSRPRWDWGRR
ncbi:MAG: AAA family ATPase [Actinomycetia bacterium]|nr:AAA family ATPase [Actinomycetes bacterium]